MAKKPDPNNYRTEAAYKRALAKYNRSERNQKAVSDTGKNVVQGVKDAWASRNNPRKPMERKKSLTDSRKPGEWQNKDKSKSSGTHGKGMQSNPKLKSDPKNPYVHATTKSKSKAKTKVSTPDTPPANNKVGPTTYAGKQPAQRGTPAQRKAKADHLAADIKSGKVKKGADPSKTASENPQIKKWKKESAAKEAKLKKLRADAYKKSVDSSTNKAKIKKKDEAKKKAETKAKKAKTKNKAMTIGKKHKGVQPSSKDHPWNKYTKKKKDKE